MTSDFNTNHHVVKIFFDAQLTESRDLERWKMNFLVLHLKTIIDNIKKTVESMPENDFIQEWMIFKTILRQKLQDQTREIKRFSSRLQNRIKKHRENLWKKQRFESLDQALEIKIKILNH